MLIFYLFLGCLMLVGIALWGIVSRAAIGSIQEMADPDPLFRVVDTPVKADPNQHVQSAIHQTDGWAQAHDFRLDVHLNFTSGVANQTIRCVFWRHQDRTRVLGLYLTDASVYFDLVTVFFQDHSLTSSSSLDAGLLPKPPGHYAQLFPQADLNQLWARHLEGEDFLITNSNWSKREIQASIVAEIKAAMRQQTAYIMQQFGWQLKGPYWYFVRRHRLANQPVSVQRRAA